MTETPFLLQNILNLCYATVTIFMLVFCLLKQRSRSQISFIVGVQIFFFNLGFTYFELSQS